MMLKSDNVDPDSSSFKCVLNLSGISSSEVNFAFICLPASHKVLNKSLSLYSQSVQFYNSYDRDLTRP